MLKPIKITLDDNVIVDTDQAAELIATPAKTLIKWRSTGEHNIPYIKIGRNVRYRTADLRAWIEKHLIGGV
jgi:excisionase family DNA binding protein